MTSSINKLISNLEIALIVALSNSICKMNTLEPYIMNREQDKIRGNMQINGKSPYKLHLSQLQEVNEVRYLNGFFT